MDASILKVVGQVAGLGGIAVAVLLFVFRDVIRKNIFSTLSPRHSYRLLSLIIVLTAGVAVAGIGGWAYVSVSVPAQEKAPKQSAEDLRLQKAMVGTWRSSGVPPAPSGFVVNELRYTLLADGTVTWRGSYTFQAGTFPILMSGKWQVKDGALHYRVESSNVPLAVKEGYAGSTKIVSVTKDAMTIVDDADGKTKVDVRIE